MRRIVLAYIRVLFLCNVVLFLIFCPRLHVCVCAGPCFGVAIVSRRGAIGPVPGAAIF
jgi:hypothetical protein